MKQAGLGIMPVYGSIIDAERIKNAVWRIIMGIGAGASDDVVTNGLTGYRDDITECSSDRNSRIAYLNVGNCDSIGSAANSTDSGRKSK